MKLAKAAVIFVAATLIFVPSLLAQEPSSSDVDQKLKAAEKARLRADERLQKRAEAKGESKPANDPEITDEKISADLAKARADIELLSRLMRSKKLAVTDAEAAKAALENANRRIASLKANGARMEKLEAELAKAKKKLAAVTTEKKASNLRAEDIIAALEKEQHSGQGAKTALETQLKELEAKVSDAKNLETKLADLGANKKATERQLTQASLLIRELTAERDHVKVTLREVASAKAAAEKSAAEARQQLVVEQKARAETKPNKNPGKEAALQKELATVKAEKAVAEKKVIETLDALKSEKELCARLTEAKKSAEVAMQDLKKELSEGGDAANRVADKVKAAGGAIAKLKQEKADADKRATALAAELDTAKKASADAKGLRERIGVLEGKSTEADKTLVEASALIRELVSKRDSLTAELAAAVQAKETELKRGAELQKRIAQLDADLAGQKKLVRDLQMNTKALTNALAALQTERDGSSTKALKFQDELKGLQLSLKEITGLKDNAANTLKRTEEQLAQLKGKNAMLTTDLQKSETSRRSAEDAVAGIKKQTEGLNKSLADMKTQLEASLKSAESLKGEVALKGKELEARAAQVLKLEQSGDALDAKKLDAEKALVEAAMLIDELSRNQANLKNQLATKSEAEKKLTEDAKQADGLQASLKIAQGEIEALRKAKNLSDMNAARLAEAMAALQKSGEELKAKLAKEQEGGKALGARKDEAEKALVDASTLINELLGSEKDLKAKLKGLETESGKNAKSLEEAIAGMKSQVADLEKAKAAAEADTKKLQTSLGATQKASRELELKLVEQSKSIETSGASVEKLSAGKSAAEQALAEASVLIRELLASKGGLETKLAKAEGDGKEASGRVATLRTQLKEVAAENDTLEKSVEESKAAIVKLEAARKISDTNASALAGVLKAAQDASNNLQVDLTSNMQALQATQTDSKKLGQEKSNSEKSLLEASLLIRELMVRLEKAKGGETKLTQELDAGKKRAGELEGKIAELEKQKKSADDGAAGLAAKLKGALDTGADLELKLKAFGQLQARNTEANKALQESSLVIQELMKARDTLQASLTKTEAEKKAVEEDRKKVREDAKVAKEDLKKQLERTKAVDSNASELASALEKAVAQAEDLKLQVQHRAAAIKERDGRIRMLEEFKVSAENLLRESRGQIDALAKSQGELQAKLTEALKQSEGSSAELKDALAKLEQMKADRDASERARITSEESLSNMRVEFARMKAAYTEVKATVASLRVNESRLVELQNSIAKTDARSGSANLALIDAGGLIKELVAKRDESSSLLAKATEEKATVEGRLAEALKSKDSARQAFDQIKVELEEARQQAMKMKKQLEDLDSLEIKKQEVEEKFAKLTTEHDDVKGRYAADQTTWQTKMQDSEKELNASQDQLVVLRKQLQAKETQFADSRAAAEDRITKLEAAKKAAEMNAVSLASLLNEKTVGYEGLVATKGELEGKFGKLDEEVRVLRNEKVNAEELGRRLTGLEAEKTDFGGKLKVAEGRLAELIAAKEQLSKKLGRAMVAKEAADKHARDAMEQLDGIKGQRGEKLTQMQKDLEDARSATADFEKVKAEMAKTAAAANDLNEKLKIEENQRFALQEEIKELSQRTKQQADSLKALTDEKNKADYELAKAKTALQDDSKLQAVLLKKDEEFGTNVAAFEDRIANLLSELDAKSEGVDETERRADEAEQKAQEAQKLALQEQERAEATLTQLREAEQAAALLIMKKKEADDANASAQNRIAQLEAELTKAARDKKQALQAALDVKQKMFRIDPIWYALNSSNVDRERARVLAQAKEVAAAYPDAKFKVTGHTCTIGTEQANLALSARRAKALVDFLSSNGIARERMTYEGMGPAKPLEDNATEEGRRRNRRVEIAVSE